MIPSVRPITRIHVSAFDGLRSLWSRRITHASDYSFLQKRLQMPSWNPHCIPHKSPEMVSSAHLCGHISTASPPSSVVSPSRPSVGPFTAPLHRCHHTTVLSLGRARHIRPFLCPRAPHPPISFPPPFPPSAHHARCAALRYVFSSMCSSSFPVPPPSPSRVVYSSVLLFLRHLIASAADLPLRVAARRVLRLSALLTISLC